MSNLIDFLNKEYELTWNSWKFIHEDRNKYVAIYVSLLAGFGYAFFWAVDRGLLPEASFVSLAFGLINLFFLRWFVGHRARSLEYIKHLNRIRGELLVQCCENKGIEKMTAVKTMILPTSDPIKSSDKIPYSREKELYKILFLLTGIGLFIFIYLLLLQWEELRCSKCSTAIIAFIVSGLFMGCLCCFLHIFQKKRYTENL